MGAHPRAAERWSGSKHPLLGFVFSVIVGGIATTLILSGVLGWSWAVGAITGIAIGVLFAAGATTMQYILDKQAGLWD